MFWFLWFWQDWMKSFNILSDFRLLKFCVILLTCWLILEELWLCLHTRPTLLSVSKARLEASHLPDVLVCPLPGFDVAQLQQLGYNQTYQYTFGLSKEGNLIGWTGNETEGSIKEIAKKISVMKEETDCPSVVATFQVNGERSSISLTAAITRALYPHGRCCRHCRNLQTFRERPVLLQVQSPSSPQPTAAV